MPTRLATTTLCVVLVTLVAACAPTSATAPPAPGSSPAGQGGQAPSAASTGSATPDAGSTLAAVDLALEPVADLEAPTAMAVRQGDEALYLTERGGRVVRVTDGIVDTEPVLDIVGQTSIDAERGLLGLAFSPDGDKLYVSFTNRAGDSQLDEYRMLGDVADLNTRRSLLLIRQPYSNHNGGNVITGPDGLLYLGLGDGGSANDPLGSGQDRSTLLGALLRIDPAPSGDDPYTIPDDNPFVGEAGARGEVWIYGLRNPWRFSFDRANNDLWIADVGQNEIEEINRLPLDDASGANLGWNAFEGSRRFSDASAPGATPPVFEYPHDGRCSIIGGYVYRGQRTPALRGAYVYGDVCDGVVRALMFEDGSVIDERVFDVRVPGLVSFGEDASGELYALSLEGTVFRITDG